MIENENPQITEVFEQLTDYAANAQNEKKLERAWNFLDDIFDQSELSEEEQDSLLGCFLIPWFLFHWTPYRYRADDGLEIDHTEQPVAFYYLEENKQTLSDYQRVFLTQMLNSHYSYYEVVELTPENNAVFLDVLLGTQHSIARTDSIKDFEVGDVIFGCMINVENQTLLIVAAPYDLTACNEEILALRDELIEENRTLTPTLLRNKCAYTLLAGFFSMLEDLMQESSDEIDDEVEETSDEDDEQIDDE